LALGYGSGIMLNEHGKEGRIQMTRKIPVSSSNKISIKIVKSWFYFN
jgi:hypothetical protein